MKEILITSSVLITALLIMRRLFEKSIPRRLQYALWALAAIRLLVPLELPGMSFSVLTMAEDAGSISERQIYVLPIDVSPEDEVPMAERADPGEAVRNAESFGYRVLSRDGTKVIKYADAVTPAQILKFVWIAGMAVMLLWTVFSNVRFWLMLKRRRVPFDAECRYRVYMVEEGLKSPCLFGRSVYLTPAAAASRESLRHVLAHEETHGKHLDPLWSLIRSLCLIIYWFDPFVWAAAAASRADCELACDEGALKVLGNDERIAYGRTLLSLIPLRRGAENPLLSATTMTAGKRELKKRISRIAERRYAAVFILAVTVIAAAVCAVTFTGGAESKPLTGEELEYFNEEFFNGEYMNICNQFLSSEYEDVRDINLFELFYCGTGIPGSVGEEEKAALEAEGHYTELDVTKLTVTDIDRVLEKYAGMTLEETGKTGMDNFIYLSEYDAYYLIHGDTNYRIGVDISYGEKKGKFVYLYYNDVFVGGGWKCVTLKKSKSGYRFVSNKEAEKPKIATVCPKNPIARASVEKASEYAAPKVNMQRRSGDLAERFDGYAEGDNLIRTYRSTDGNIYAAIISDDSPDGWEAESFLTLPGKDNENYSISFFWELFGYSGLIISYEDNEAEGMIYDYYAFPKEGEAVLLARAHGEKGREPKIIDLDGDGEEELAAGGRILFKKGGAVYEADINEILGENFSFGEWDKNYRRLQASGFDDEGKEFNGWIYFDGENILLYGA